MSEAGLNARGRSRASERREGIEGASGFLGTEAPAVREAGGRDEIPVHVGRKPTDDLDLHMYT